MKIVKSLDLEGYEFPKQVACLGVFDGLHIGHQKLLKTVVTTARKKKYQALFFTFSISPKILIRKERTPELLTLACKERLVAQFGFDNFVIFQFNHQTRTWSINDFISYLKKLNIEIIVIGKDFRFANLAAGNINHLQANFSQVIVVHDVIKNKSRVSTTKIRLLLKNKQLAVANQLLLQPYEIEGMVVKGNEWARKINFPTANIHLDNNFNVLSAGVYITFVWVDSKKYEALSCIININGILKCESYLFNFTGNLYSKIIRIVFLEYLRDNLPLQDLAHLKRLIQTDCAQALAYFNKIG